MPATKKQKVEDVYKYTPEGLAAAYQTLKDHKDKYLNADILPAGDLSERQGDYAPTKLICAATQFTAGGLEDSSVQGFCDRVEQAVQIAVETHGAHIILLPELWVGPYFCQSQEACLLTLADDASTNILLQRMSKIAKHYKVVLPVSFYERHHNALYNAVAMMDADGTNLGIYRKAHIPDGPGYQEKFYFTPGDTVGFGVFDSKVYGVRLGVAICWDQWFPETARCLALQGCELIMYPTAIGSEPKYPTLNSADHWQRAMQGHSASNMVPVIASNRFGTEILLNDDMTEKQRIHFYGRSFVTDATGAKVGECPDNTADTPVLVVATEIDPEQQRRNRAAWGLFRDRRPELYQPLMTKDGSIKK